jgi:hypothetical protein
MTDRWSLIHAADHLGIIIVLPAMKNHSMSMISHTIQRAARRRSTYPGPPIPLTVLFWLRLLSIKAGVLAWLGGASIWILGTLLIFPRWYLATEKETSMDVLNGLLGGKKTYLIALAVGLVTAAQALGWIDSEIYQVILGFLGAGGLATLRAGVTSAGADPT